MTISSHKNYKFSLIALVVFAGLFLVETEKADARTLVAIWSHYPCNNHVYSDGSHVPYPRRQSTPPPPPPPDQCTNIRGYQYPVPQGYERQGSNCFLKKDEFYLSCSAVNNPIKPGSEAVFQANSLYTKGAVSFSWHDGDTSSGTLLKRQTVKNTSFYRDTYNVVGVKKLTVVGVDTDGTRKQASCAVSVSNNSSVIDGEGNADLGPVTIDFDILGGLTNSTCPATWTSQNATECFLIDGDNENADSVSVPLSGTKDVKPGIWKLQCVSSTLNGGSAQVLLSDPEICNSNIDIREV